MKKKFDNPFMWGLIDFNSMYYMIQNFENINFKNFELLKDNNWNFSLKIDDKIIIKYIHYKFDPKATKIIKKDFDVFYNKIWEYIIQKYEERLERMLNIKEEPIFILANWYNVPETNLTYQQLKLLNDLNKNSIIVGVDKIYSELTNLKQIIRDNDKPLYNRGLAEKIYIEFIKNK
jgi:hypothetical protein